jgi:anti-sigma regulatory factor (Ser/Thr protein kinase)
MSNARRFSRQPESVAGARHFVRDLLSEQPRETVEAAELMTSELATNSVRHAHSDFELTVHLSQDEIRVEVSDYGPGEPVPRSPAPRDRSGRGLRIVQELAADWGVTPSSNGKLVWFTLPLQSSEAEHEPRSIGSAEKASEQSHDADLRSSHSRSVKPATPRKTSHRPWASRREAHRSRPALAAPCGRASTQRHFALCSRVGK